MIREFVHLKKGDEDIMMFQEFENDSHAATNFLNWIRDGWAVRIASAEEFNSYKGVEWSDDRPGDGKTYLCLVRRKFLESI